MARLFFLALLSLSLSFVVSGSLVIQQHALSNERVDEPVHASNSWDYTDCGLKSDPVQVKSINVSPDPPLVGEQLTVTVVADVLERIEEGAYVDVTVKLGLIKLLSKEFDLCEEARNANATVQCPVEAGTYTITETADLPKEIPKAKFSVSALGYSNDDDSLFCVLVKVNFMNQLWGW